MKNAAARRSPRTSSDNEDWTRSGCRCRPVGGGRGRRHVASKRRVADNLLWEVSRSSPSSTKPGAAMGTKISLNYCVDEASGMTANLTEECLAPEDFPVTLELTGVAEASFQVTERGNRITVEISRGLAIKLGLLPDDPTVNATEAR